MLTGMEHFCQSPPSFLKGKRLALLCNQASTDRHLRHTRDLLEQIFPGQLTCLFSPQHGFYSEKQDNMIESGDIEDSDSIPVFSLYSDKRRPTPEQFDLFDVLLIDLVDIGTRVYTFSWTVVYCLELAADTGKKVIVLDRPNPIGGHLVEGNVLKDKWSSFVGLYPIPMRHGLTLGELAFLCNKEMAINAELDVIIAKGWKRSDFFHQTGLTWVFPSPNMPSAATAMVYPGQVLWEGTNISEGRGTTLPFELFGAPFLNCGQIEKTLIWKHLPGCFLRPLVFEPGFGKWANSACNGFQLHVTDLSSFRPYRTSLSLLQAIMRLYPDEFEYKQPPYEYEYERLPLDLILGDKEIRLALEDGIDVIEIERTWQKELDLYNELRSSVLLYA